MAAPSGGGGGGGPVGFANSFTGTAQALEIVGDHGYAYSGLVSDAGSGSADATAFSFTSGNYYWVGQIDYLSNLSTNTNRFIEISFNDAIVFAGKWDNDGWEVNPLTMLLIPAYTEVKVKFGASEAVNATFVLTGRIYR